MFKRTSGDTQNRWIVRGSIYCKNNNKYHFTASINK